MADRSLVGKRATVYGWCKRHPEVVVCVVDAQPNTLHGRTTGSGTKVYVRHSRKNCGTCDMLHGWIDKAWLSPAGRQAGEKLTLFGEIHKPDEDGDEHNDPDR